jgi:hypothetical protein
MFPHERSLVKQLEGKPFALIGINSDRDREDCKKKNQENQITWRSFWNGEQGTGGPISAKWNVHGWPTMYLIDSKGIIRHKYLGSPGGKVLNELIAQLLKADGVNVELKEEPGAQ